MTIMLAGGMTIAAPSMLPQAAAAGQLYVSAENAQFGNFFGGAQIVEIIVRDPNRADTEVAEAEPTVRVDNHLLRMAQGADGFWYAYIGSDTHVTAANTADNFLNFGTDGTTIGHNLGTDGNNALTSNLLTNYASSIFTADSTHTEVIQNAPVLSDYNNTDNTRGDGLDAAFNKQINTDGTSTVGQIGVNQSQWPFIQTFDFTQEDFDIILEQPGVDEVVTLEYNNNDLDDFASLSLDRNSAPQGSEVHMAIVDQQLNIDPTNEDVVVFYVTSSSTTAGVSFTNGTTSIADTNRAATATSDYAFKAYDNYFGDNGKLIIDYDAASSGTNVLVNANSTDDPMANAYLVFYEDADNTGTWSNVSDDDEANLEVNKLGARGTTATFDYNDESQSLVIANDFGVIDMDETSVGDEWNSGEVLIVTLTDQDLNRNTLNDEDLKVSGTFNGTATLVPALKIGNPVVVVVNATDATTATEYVAGAESVSDFSSVATYHSDLNDDISATFAVQLGYTYADIDAIDTDHTFFNWDFSSFGTVTSVGLNCGDASTAAIASGTTAKGFAEITLDANCAAGDVMEATVISTPTAPSGTVFPVQDPTFVADVMTFGDRTNNAIYRLELEETGFNTSEFVGEIEYIMLNQLNNDQDTTYSGLSTISDEITIIVHEDLTDEDSPRVNYFDKGADGVDTQISDQVEAPSHSGVVSLDADNYKTADTVVVTLDDQDMNTDSDLIDVYVTQSDNKVGDSTHVGDQDHVMDITFDDSLWTGLQATGFTLVETDVDSGLFVGSFQIPAGQTGKDIEVNYNDHRDASGETIEVGDGAAVNANTGSVAFDRSVYPVPFGNSSSDTRFAIHSAAAHDITVSGSEVSNALAVGNVTVHVRVTDADYDVSASGEDKINDTTVEIKLIRGSNSTVINVVGNADIPIYEVSPNSGVFEWDQQVGFADGPTTDCPAAFAGKGSGGNQACVLQGDIITVTYTDVSDASGQSQTVTDSATFDLRNGVLQSDKSVYLIGSDMILTLIEPDFDRDNDTAESYTLDLIEFNGCTEV
jgi:hypothetical protein